MKNICLYGKNYGSYGKTSLVLNLYSPLYYKVAAVASWTIDSREGQTARASSKLEPKMASFHCSALALKKFPEPKNLALAPK